MSVPDGMAAARESVLLRTAGSPTVRTSPLPTPPPKNIDPGQQTELFPQKKRPIGAQKLNSPLPGAPLRRQPQTAAPVPARRNKQRPSSGAFLRHSLKQRLYPRTEKGTSHLFGATRVLQHPTAALSPAIVRSEAFESGSGVHFLQGGFHRSVAVYVRMKAPLKKCANGPLSEAAAGYTRPNLRLASCIRSPSWGRRCARPCPWWPCG
ncbi:hypothetical protein EDC59_11342 [Pseudodesulfovibrio indicus]|uniref:Uncharacterized protein n=1 Tax=Pseudodesulfovibrio indicus TaxID=1716143 RepID=A0AA94PL23_9BACT|nr:hypothetical protein EDC59_11342 [Pseudodesulfovibrio indicus]